MRKRKLKRRLRECRETLDQLLAEDAPEPRDAGLSAAGGLCVPVPTWRESQEAGICYETPGLCEPERRRIKELEEQLDKALDAEGSERARANRFAADANGLDATLQRERAKLREAERHLHHHHANGPFTLVREVSEQVAAENTKLRRKIRERDDRVVAVVAEMEDAREALEWYAERYCNAADPNADDLIAAYRAWMSEARDEAVPDVLYTFPPGESVSFPIKQCSDALPHLGHVWGTLDHQAWCEGVPPRPLP